MEEIEKREMTKNGKVFTALVVESIRDLVDVAHEEQIPREDMITILKDKDKFVLFYYK